MKLGILVIRDELHLDKYINMLKELNITEITIFDSNCIADKQKTVKIFYSMRHINDYFYDESKTIIFPLNDEEKLEQLIASQKECILFVMPLLSVVGSIK